MRFMANVNKIIKFLIFFVIVLYVYYVYYDNERNKSWGDRKTFELHLKNLKANGKTYTGLIVGGSNSVWGLSAEQLNKSSDLNYYNLSILHEGRNSRAHEKFMRQATDDYLDKDKIQEVIYSSIVPFHETMFKAYNGAGISNSVWGPYNVGVKPFTSYYRYAKERYYYKQKTPDWFHIISTYGDLDFSNQPCPADLYHYRYEMAGAKKVALYLNNKAEFLSELYPKAKVAVLLPSEHMYLARYPRAWANEVVSEFQKKAKANHRIIVQAQIPDISMVCSGVHHPNAKGREWRTQQLINSLKGNEAISF